MLARYQIRRGVPASELPQGVRQDTRTHTRHVLRPEADVVREILENPTHEVWCRAMDRYRDELARRFADDPGPFDDLADLAREHDVHLGCNCPTKKVPDVRMCHTVAALEFMHERYPDLDVRMPAE